MTKILILGIGNILFQDEGIGVHFIHYLDEKYDFSNKYSIVHLMDGGTLAQRLIPEIVKYDKVVVVDCIDALDSSPGDVYFFDYKKTPNHINWQGSAHEVEMLQTLNMIDMNNDLPQTDVIGIIPKRLNSEDTAFDLSEEVINAVKIMEKTVIKYLKENGIIPKIKNHETTIDYISQISFKRDIIHQSDI